MMWYRCACLLTVLALVLAPNPLPLPPSHAVGLLLCDSILVFQAICSLRSQWWMRRCVPLVEAQGGSWEGASWARLFIVSRPPGHSRNVPY